MILLCTRPLRAASQCPCGSGFKTILFSSRVVWPIIIIRAVSRGSLWFCIFQFTGFFLQKLFSITFLFFVHSSSDVYTIMNVRKAFRFPKRDSCDSLHLRVTFQEGGGSVQPPHVRLRPRPHREASQAEVDRGDVVIVGRRRLRPGQTP